MKVLTNSNYLLVEKNVVVCLNKLNLIKIRSCTATVGNSERNKDLGLVRFKQNRIHFTRGFFVPSLVKTGLVVPEKFI